MGAEVSRCWLFAFLLSFELSLVGEFVELVKAKFGDTTTLPLQAKVNSTDFWETTLYPQDFTLSTIAKKPKNYKKAPSL